MGAQLGCANGSTFQMCAAAYRECKQWHAVPPNRAACDTKYGLSALGTLLCRARRVRYEWHTSRTAIAPSARGCTRRLLLRALPTGPCSWTPQTSLLGARKPAPPRRSLERAARCGAVSSPVGCQRTARIRCNSITTRNTRVACVANWCPVGWSNRYAGAKRSFLLRGLSQQSPYGTLGGDSVFPRGEHRCSSRQHWKQPCTHGREHTREWRTRSMSTESRGRVARTICTLRRGHTWPRLKSYTVRVAAMTAPARCAASSGGWRIDGHGTVPRGRGIGLNRNVWLMTVRERCTLQRGICRGRCPWRRKRRRENSVPSCAQDSTPVK